MGVLGVSIIFQEYLMGVYWVFQEYFKRRFMFMFKDSCLSFQRCYNVFQG